MPFKERFRLPLMMLLAGALFSSGWAVGRSTASDSSGSGKVTPAPRKSTTTAPAPIAPLTGLPDRDGKAATRPALSVKIDNSTAALPQAGLDKADLVYEEAVEHGITRFLAVFHSRDGGAIGPIRSVRPMDPIIATPLGGLFAYSGGIPAFVTQLHKAPVQDVGWDSLPASYARRKNRKAPSNLFTDTAKLWKVAEERYENPPEPLFTFLSGKAAFVGDAILAINISFSGPSKMVYSYDAKSGTWLRSQDGKPHKVESGQQIAPTNLVIQFVKQRFLTQRDPAGTRVPETIVTGEGEAWVLSQGKVVKGRWSRPGASGVTRYLNASLGPISLTPGTTWVHLVPEGSVVTFVTPTTTTAKKIPGTTTTARR